jgi:hypothetical protein
VDELPQDLLFCASMLVIRENETRGKNYEEVRFCSGRVEFESNRRKERVG